MKAGIYTEMIFYDPDSVLVSVLVNTNISYNKQKVEGGLTDRLSHKSKRYEFIWNMLFSEGAFL